MNPEQAAEVTRLARHESREDFIPYCRKHVFPLIESEDNAVSKAVIREILQAMVEANNR